MTELGSFLPQLTSNDKKKIISVGLQHTQKSPPRRQPTNVFDYEDEAQNSQQYWQDEPIVQSRKPFVRKIEDTEKITGLVIGKQFSREELVLQKAEAQRQYRSQLQRDMAGKSDTSPTTAMKIVSRKQYSPPANEGGLFFGANDEEMTDKKRAQAKKFYELNARDLAAKASQKIDPSEPGFQSLKNHRRAATKASSESHDRQQPLFTIGTDPDLVRQRKVEAQRSYLAQLDADCDRQPIVQSRRSRDPSPQFYVNTHGFTGLDIGGVASETTQSQREIVVKQSKQESYRRALDQQRELTKQLTEEKAQTERNEAQGPVPYMQY